MNNIKLITQELDLEQSETLRHFACLAPEEWTIRRGSGRWEFDRSVLRGFYEPAEGGARHGQVFFDRPFTGEVVLEFDARLPEGSSHDLVWFYQTGFEQAPWGEGYLGCLGGWYGAYAGLERTPSFRPSIVFAWKKIEPERDYHVVSGTAGGISFIAVDGEMILHYSDPNPIAPEKTGHIGFGLYQSDVEYRNIRVMRPHLRDIAHGYSSLPPRKLQNNRPK